MKDTAELKQVYLVMDQIYMFLPLKSLKKKSMQVRGIFLETGLAFPFSLHFILILCHGVNMT